jgi:hypothetical protein
MNPPSSRTIVECDWCHDEHPCEPADTGTGQLWICGYCADALLDGVIDDESEETP